MAYKEYDYKRHFAYIADVLGDEVSYDNLSLHLDGRLFLRNEKDGNYAQIVYLTNDRFRVILCLNKLGCIVHKTSKSFETCINFLKDQNKKIIINTLFFPAPGLKARRRSI